MAINTDHINSGRRDLFHDEEGFSTVGMVLALLITLALVFTAAQVYQINSVSGDVQSIADAAALAAENEIAEFFILVRVCDALVLSLSLVGLVVLGVGLIALCVPPVASLGETLLKTGKDILKARDNFAQKAADSLNKLQKLLPFFCAVEAAEITSSNSGGALDSNYLGFAIALPFKGEEIVVGSLENADELVDDIEAKQDEIKQAAQEAEDAASEANKEKAIAFAYDCGNNPSYCMYERADTLAGLSPSDNPLYRSVDTWSFSVSLKRAQKYYPVRLQQEKPEDESVKSSVNSALRKRFYTYAVSELEKGYVHEEEAGTFDAYFPRLPKNTSEMKQTTLYTDVVYPFTSSSGKQVMHAWEGCPGLAGGSIASYGSISQLESGAFEECVQCEFTAASMGKIAAASTSIENGFEYHYNKAADAAEAYQKAREEYEPKADMVKSLTGGLFDEFSEVFQQALSSRISAKPPGRFGAIAFVICLDQANPSSNFESSFVQSDGVLGTRAAISAATLVNDSSGEGNTVISSLLDGISGQFESGLIEGADIVLDIWSSVLMGYGQGQEGLEKGLSTMLDGIPLLSESGLGDWAASAFSEIVEGVGLQPAELYSPKPVLVNSAQVLAADESSFSVRFLSTKQAYMSSEGDGSGDLFTTILSYAEASALESLEPLSSEIEIASIEFLGENGPRIPLTITLPQTVTQQANGFVEDAFSAIQNCYEEVLGGRRWE